MHGLLAPVSLWFQGLGVAWRFGKAWIVPAADERAHANSGLSFRPMGLDPSAGSDRLASMGFLEHVGISADDATTTAHTDQTSENVSGGVHGGLLATMLDSAMGSACRAELDDEDAKVVTVQLSVTYLNGAEPGDDLRADATVKKASKALCLVDGEVRRVSDELLVAQGQATFAVLHED